METILLPEDSPDNQKLRGMAYIGAVLRQYRQNMGLTQNQVARLLRKTKATVSRVENGQLLPSAKLLSLWAKAVNLPPKLLDELHTVRVLVRDGPAVPAAIRERFRSHE